MKSLIENKIKEKDKAQMYSYNQKESKQTYLYLSFEKLIRIQEVKI